MNPGHVNEPGQRSRGQRECPHQKGSHLAPGDRLMWTELERFNTAADGDTQNGKTFHIW